MTTTLATPERPAILMVDDDPRKLTALKSVLAPLGLRLVVATSGTDALRHLLREDFRLILLDVHMAGMDGFETAAFIRTRARSALTPIIFMTAADQSEVDVERGYGLGAIDFLTSPWVPEALRTKVERVIGGQSDRSDLLRQIDDSHTARETASDYRNMTAHQIRAPLGVISGYLSMLVDGTLTTDAPEWPRILTVLVEKAQAIDQLASDLLLVAQAESSDSGSGRIDFNSEAKAASQRAAARAGLLKIKLEFEGGDAVVDVYGDHAEVGLILDNLIANAISYSLAGASVTVRLVNDQNPRIEIEDQGAGIPIALRKRIFEAFYRVAPNQEAKGSGLGLYLSRKLAVRNNGHLDLLGSELGVGSTFGLSLERCGTYVSPN